MTTPELTADERARFAAFDAAPVLAESSPVVRAVLALAEELDGEANALAKLGGPLARAAEPQRRAAARIRATVAAVLAADPEPRTVGVCFDNLTGIGGDLLVCTLAAGHAGAHESDDGARWIKADPEPREQVVERMARAMAAESLGLDVMDEDGWEYYLRADEQLDWLRLAAAALDASRGRGQ